MSFRYRSKDSARVTRYRAAMMKLSSHDALLVVDVQNDFLPGGALPVGEGDAVIPVINRLSALPFGTVVVTQDWHPSAHCSFREQGGQWPTHCVAGTTGAELASGLDQRHVALILRKGLSPSVDSYSAFRDNSGAATTGLEGWLRAMGMARVFVTGLALDVCVTETARDAQKAGFATFVVEDACRGIAPGADATKELRKAGIPLLLSTELST